MKTKARDLLLAYVKVLQVSCARWGLAGIFFRGYANSINVGLSTRFFSLYGTEYLSLISFWTFGSIIIGGSFSAIFVGGYLSDRYDQKYMRAKSLIASLSILGYAVSHFFEFYYFVSIYYAMSFVTIN